MEVAPSIIRLKEASPVRYLKYKSFDRRSQKFNSQKIKTIIEDYNGGFIQTRMPGSTTRGKSALEDYADKRLNKSIWVVNTRKKLDAKNYHHPEDTQARKRARDFLSRIRQLNLIELPKITYFDEMIRQSCVKEFKKRRPEPAKSSSTIARYSVTRIEDHRSYPMNEHYVRLRNMLDEYPPPEHINTDPF